MLASDPGAALVSVAVRALRMLFQGMMLLVHEMQVMLLEMLYLVVLWMLALGLLRGLLRAQQFWLRKQLDPAAGLLLGSASAQEGSPKAAP